jgi:hypothetical protein
LLRLPDGRVDFVDAQTRIPDNRAKRFHAPLRDVPMGPSIDIHVALLLFHHLRFGYRNILSHRFRQKMFSCGY